MINRNRLFSLPLAAAWLALSGAACGTSSSGNSGSNGTGGTGGSATTSGTSCQSMGPGLSDCGESKESCCTSLPLPGGQFYRSYGNEFKGILEGGTEGDLATVSALRLDKYLVTVGRFREFVAALNGEDGGPGYTPSPGSGKHTHLNNGRGLEDSGSLGDYETGWDPTYDTYLPPSSVACDEDYATWTPTAGANENLPMNCANWFQAYAFCIWDGGFLPSENEFEFATAGGGQQRLYPWGSTDPGGSSMYAIYFCDYNTDDAGGCAGVTNIAPVGTATLGAGFYGHLDLAGELNEWLLDYNASYVDPCIDCAFLTHASGREARGGFFNDSSTIDLQSAYRNEGLYPTNNYKSNGFRCARTP